MITVYKKSTGEIVKVCTCIESDIPLQYDLTIEAYIEGNYDYNKYYIQNNKPILISDAPSQYHKFNYDTKQWVDPRTNITQWAIIKDQRNQLLAASDWTQLPDVSLDTKSNWATYRQALRDITTQEDPFNIIWPIAPY